MIKKTNYYSKKIGNVAKGCQFCVKGRKLVLFITGLCPRNCFYCPISDTKYKKDVIYANEWPIHNLQDMVTEAKLCSATGAGITGGDPLCKLSRTVKAIRMLKKAFGKQFHIHLYTSFDLATKANLSKLYKAGLNEIRFHPDLLSNKLWNRIDNAKQFDWDIGIEVPAVPKLEKQSRAMIDYFAGKVLFININELEVADNKVNRLLAMGYRVKDRLSYAVKGSEKTAVMMLKYINKKYPKQHAHYCTAKLKDRVQMTNRIKLRAKNVAKEYDIISDEGTLIRGAIYGKNLRETKEKLRKEFGIPAQWIEYDKKQDRILIAPWVVEKLKDSLIKRKLKPAIVEEYPTWDMLKIDVRFLY